jgi:hypothetical protein
LRGYGFRTASICGPRGSTSRRAGQLDLARAIFESLRAHPWLSRVDAQIQRLTDATAFAGETAGLTRCAMR